MSKPKISRPPVYERGVPPIANAVALAKHAAQEFAKVQRAQPNVRTVTVTEDYTVTALDRVILVDTMAGAVTVTLPTAAQLLANPITVIKISDDANAVTIAPASGETIAGESTASLSAVGDATTLTPDAHATWWPTRGSGSGGARVAVDLTTAALASGATENGSVPLSGATMALLQITVDRACWVRLYASDADRAADAGRSVGTQGTAGTGLLAEFVATGATAIDVSPVALLTNTESPVQPRAWYAVQNQSGSSSPVVIALTVLPMEM